MTLRPRLFAASLLAAIAAILLVASAQPARAHAALLETTPFDGQTVEEAPEQVTWTFNEAVTSTTGALRIFDADGERVDTGQQTQPAADQLAIGLRDDVRDGTYIATYRVTSADGHLIRGAFVFSVGTAGAVDDDTLAALFAGGDGAVALVAGIGRAAGYVGALLLGGAMLWTLAVARGAVDERARADRWAARGALAVLAAAVVTLPVHAMLTSGLGAGALTSGAVVGETLRSSVGLGAVVRLVAAGVVLVLVRRGRGMPAGLATLVVLGSFLVDGHTRTVEPAWLVMVGDAAHLAAGAAWFGGLVVLAGTVRARRLDDDPAGAADVVARFSRVATWSIVVVAAAGSAMSWAMVRQPRALTGTDYGWTLLVKVALVAMVVLVGAYNNRRLVPAVVAAAALAGGSVDSDAATTAAESRARVGRAAWARLGRTARLEVGLLVTVLAVTAFLVNLRPGAEEAGITGAFDTLVVMSDDLQLNLVVDPNRVGFNEIHFYLLDRTGRPISELESVEVLLTQVERDIGPIAREPFVAGPGHWQLDGRDLAVPGEWQVELVVGVDRFTETRVTVPVVVNP